MYQLGFCESRDFERSIKNESRTFGKSLNRDVPNLTKMYTCQCATFVGNSYQTFGLATDKTYQTELNLTGPNKNNDFSYNKC